jgi:hypothetical protein
MIQPLAKLLSRFTGLSLRQVRKVIVAVVGSTVLLLGLAMVVLPGPAIVVIPLGLAILATEFVWARRWLQRTRDFVGRRDKKRGSAAAPSAPTGRPAPPAPAHGWNPKAPVDKKPSADNAPSTPGQEEPRLSSISPSQ